MKGNESKTQLRGKETVFKDDVCIMLRGEIDSLMARAVITCAYAKQYGHTDIISGTEDVVRVLREITRSEALGEPCEAGEILGMDFEELRTVSQHPKSELGAEHYFPDENTDMMTAMLNMLRADVRRAERQCVEAMDEHPAAASMQIVLNRLSSAVYILMLESRMHYD
ncbi:hypothetical protein LJC56_05955 [Christensenellaceae bacterium OttesenSCG-928-K19]|nr:hypothetical protein [Christensenellaceae bacterium OttesenSCG-928-K19]